MIAPPFYLVLGLGIVSLAVGFYRSKHRVLHWGAPAVSSALALVLVVVSLTQLWQVYEGPGYRKDDNRAAVAYIRQHYEPGDVVILMMDTYQSYEYYGGDGIPYVPLQPGGDTVSAANSLNGIAAGHKRIWLYLWNAEWADPTGWVRQALDTAYPQEPVDRKFTGIGLQLFDVTPEYRFTPPTNPSIPKSINFGNQMQLVGYDLPQSNLTAGNSGKITFYWKAETQINQDYIISLRLTDPQFDWWQGDFRPTRFNFATMYWKPGQIVSGELTFKVPSGNAARNLLVGGRDLSPGCRWPEFERPGERPGSDRYDIGRRDDSSGATQYSRLRRRAWPWRTGGATTLVNRFN